MAPSSAPQPAISIFGATGGSCLALLARLLTAKPTPYAVTALARTPPALSSALLKHSTHPVPQAALEQYLTIIGGPISDSSAVKRTLQIRGGEGSALLTDTIFSGIGARPKWPAWSSPTIYSQVDICEQAVNSIVTSLQELKAMTKGGALPLLVTLSTMGISSTGERDVPLLLHLPYQWLLRTPHVDKRKMEEATVTAKKDGGAIRDFVLVRASLPTDGAALGIDKVRAGKEGENPPLGYTISREDVGNWMFEEIVVKGGRACEGSRLTITH